MSTPAPDPALNELADALARLVPAPGQFDRDALIYRAGLAAARPRPSWLWPCATAAMALLAAGLGAALFLQTPRQQVREVVVIRDLRQEPEPPPAPAPSAAGETPARQPPLTFYTQLQEQVLRWGLDGLPQQPPPAGNGPALEQLPGTPANPWGQPGRKGL